jgi:phospholipase C
MSRFALISISILLLSAAALLLSLNGCGGGTGSTHFSVPPPNSKVQHVVIIFQENRPPDNLFQGLCLPPNGSSSSCNSTNPTASQYDIASSGTNSLGANIPLLPLDLGTTASNGNPDTYDLNHAHQAFVQMCDLNTSGACAMDGADLVQPSCNTGVTPPCWPTDPQFKYVYPDDVQPYLTMALTYTFADHMFQTNQGPSYPAHQFILSGTSAPSAPPAALSNAFVSENPVAASGAAVGCMAPSDETVRLIDPTGGEDNPLYPPIYPCFEHPTLTDSLENANLSWRYYTPTPGSIWTAPNSIEHICGPNAAPPNGTACTGSDWTSNVVLRNARVLTDIANGQLATVSWVIPAGQASDHALINEGTGPSWVSSVVNAIGNSQYWSNTVIIVAWDDWGGWYDHVPPPQLLSGSNCAQWGCGYVYGFRVPMIVISPYAKAAYISHVTHDFGSILNFIETTFSLPSLGYADAHADDLSDCFNFNQTPLTFQTISAPSSAERFLNDKRPPTDPDDD